MHVIFYSNSFIVRYAFRKLVKCAVQSKAGSIRNQYLSK